MNYLWETILESRKTGIKESKLKYRIAEIYSAYMEIALECLNQLELPENYLIEINPYYRFFEIFVNMYSPEMKEYKQLRDCLTNLMFHLLGDNDVRMGMTKEEYFKKLLLRDISQGVFGENIQITKSYFCDQEWELILSGCLRMYRTGSSLLIFTELFCKLTPNSIVYHGNEKPHEILIYINEKKTFKIEIRVTILIQLFLDIHYVVELYYEHHFAILGIDDAMMINGMVLR